MTGHPLHAEPARPVLDSEGNLANPLDPGAVVTRLKADTPLRVDQLKPNAIYASPRFEYLTDQASRPARIRGVLQIVKPGQRVRHRQPQRQAGQSGNHGGHIIAVSLGGFASGPNLFPQNSNFNVSAYARLEHGWRRALRDGLTVAVDIALTGDSAAPEFLIVTHWEQSEQWETVLLNEDRAQ